MTFNIVTNAMALYRSWEANPRGLTFPQWLTDKSCDHLPALSEPSLTLHCTKCGLWLKALNDYDHEAVERSQATRGQCAHSAEARADGWCPTCHEELEGL